MKKDDLMNKAAKIIPHPPLLINLVTKRVRQLNQGRAPLINPATYGMRLGQGDIALLEIIEGKISSEEALDNEGFSGGEKTREAGKKAGRDTSAADQKRMRAQAFAVSKKIQEKEHFEKAAHDLFASGDPVFEVDPADAQGIVQVWPDGRRVRGRLKGRKFVPASAGSQGTK